MTIKFNDSADIRDVLSNTLKTARIYSGESIREVAARCGLSIGAISELERGKGSVETAWKLLRTFGAANLGVTLDLDSEGMEYI